jgi:hypothetical protein
MVNENLAGGCIVNSSEVPTTWTDNRIVDVNGGVSLRVAVVVGASKGHARISVRISPFMAPILVSK